MEWQSRSGRGAARRLVYHFHSDLMSKPCDGSSPKRWYGRLCRCVSVAVNPSVTRSLSPQVNMTLRIAENMSIGPLASVPDLRPVFLCQVFGKSASFRRTTSIKNTRDEVKSRLPPRVPELTSYRCSFLLSSSNYSSRLDAARLMMLLGAKPR